MTGHLLISASIIDTCIIGCADKSGGRLSRSYRLYLDVLSVTNIFMLTWFGSGRQPPFQTVGQAACESSQTCWQGIMILRGYLCILDNEAGDGGEMGGGGSVGRGGGRGGGGGEDKRAQLGLRGAGMAGRRRVEEGTGMVQETRRGRQSWGAIGSAATGEGRSLKGVEEGVVAL